MKYELKNRYTGKVQVVAEIEFGDNASVSTKKRLSVLWAIENGVDLIDTYLSEADLYWADLRGANLSWADLSEAKLYGANLSDADLSGADLSGADLRWADLSRADLRYIKADNCDYIKNINDKHWDAVYTSDQLAIGCKQYSIEEWQSFDDDEIDKMDRSALSFWSCHKKEIFDIIESNPSKPTGVGNG